MAHAPLLADAGLVLEHQAEALAGMCIGNRLQAITEPPKSRLRGLVLVGVVRPCLLSREAEPAHHAAHRSRDGTACRSAPREKQSEILQRVGRDAVDLGIGTGQDHLGKLGLLVGVEPRWTTIAPAIRKTVDAVGVVANNPVAQRLPVHASRPRRRLPAHARQAHWRSPAGDAPPAHRAPSLASDRSSAGDTIHSDGKCRHAPPPRISRGNGITLRPVWEPQSQSLRSAVLDDEPGAQCVPGLGLNDG